jgi:hypothetical protein
MWIRIQLFTRNADPDPASKNDADPDPAFKKQNGSTGNLEKNELDDCSAVSFLAVSSLVFSSRPCSSRKSYCSSAQANENRSRRKKSQR